MGKKVLVVDTGGRGHALAWKLKQSPHVSKVFVAPGNGGTERMAANIPLKVTDISALLEFAKSEKIDLTVVGNEDALAAGIVDVFQAAGLKIFGPTRNAALIEASKVYSKNLMRRFNVPTAGFATFTSIDAAVQFVKMRNEPFVVKANGLALGKGAYVCHNVSDGLNAISDIMVKGIFGSAGYEIVVEGFVDGPEVSVHALCDGKNYILLPTAQDHKPALDGDKGKNTGGMGTIAPVPGYGVDFLARVGEEIVQPTIKGLAQDGASFTGCLYPGLKIPQDGPKVLEFNARFGDPETQSYMRLLESDLFELLEACVNGNLSDCDVRWAPGFAVCIIAASKGYPDSYKKGFPIVGIQSAERIPGVVVFHSGTAWQKGCLVTSGGRVLGVTAIGKTLPEALETAYSAVNRIAFPGMQFRSDIGQKALSMSE